MLFDRLMLSLFGQPAGLDWPTPTGSTSQLTSSRAAQVRGGGVGLVIRRHTLRKVDAVRQQIESAIELYYACRYASAVTLAGAADDWLDSELVKRKGRSPTSPQPTAKECPSRAQSLAAAHLRGVRDWLTYKTGKIPICQITESDVCTMILQAVTSLGRVFPGSETAIITGFLADLRARGLAPRRGDADR
jgi:hypothetical protein